MITEEFKHYPVLLDEVLQGLNIVADGCYIDCTFGRGGHSRAILQQLGPKGRLLAMDRDMTACAFATNEQKNDTRFSIEHAAYSRLREITERYNLLGKVNGILFDLGVSSPQLDDPQRGFSFMRSGTLDMRMDNSTGISAAQWLNNARESEIADVIKKFGEEKFSKRIARAIVSARTEKPLDTTADLSELIKATVPVTEKDKHPATRTFQAIRIFINHELDELEQALGQTLDILADKGRLVVISFHSLEDRMVKRFMRNHARGDDFPVEVPVTESMIKPQLKLIGKPIRPNSQEVDRNPRSRSAIMRIAERMAA